VTDQPEVTIEEFSRRLNAGWDQLNAFIGSLSPEQLTGPSDAAGWSVKDHLMHLAVWEDGMNAMLTGQPRSARMRIDEATWQGGDFDAINAVIHEYARDVPLETVLANLRRAHEELHTRLMSLGTTDLLRPRSDFQADSDSGEPVVWLLVGNTFGHYEEHLPWMQAIVEQG
jgi:uncharacterized protein (TIGR03083 family)